MFFLVHVIHLWHVMLMILILFDVELLRERERERERIKLCWKVGHEPNEHVYGLLRYQVYALF